MYKRKYGYVTFTLRLGDLNISNSNIFFTFTITR